MKGYKVGTVTYYGDEYDLKYSTNYNRAIQEFNNLLRKVIKEIGQDVISKEDFGEEITSFREHLDERELICRKYPVLIYKYKNVLRANIFFWEKTSYEYDEWDVITADIKLEEIEILE